MNEIIVISLIVAVILGVVFWRRKGGEEVSDFVEPSYHPSGKQWVFNGILDIENPPKDNSCLVGYKGRVQLMTRKGYMLYEMQVDSASLSRDDVGVYEVDVQAGNGSSLSVCHQGRVIGRLDSIPSWLSAKSADMKKVRAYAFIACQTSQDGDEYYGDVCIGK